MEEKLRLLIGRLLAIGLLVSIIITLVGGIYYLASNYNEKVIYQVFTPESAQFTSIKEIFEDIFSPKASEIIQLGILLLVFAQIVRLLLTAWFFLKLKEKTLLFLTLGMTAVITYNLFFRF